MHRHTYRLTTLSPDEQIRFSEHAAAAVKNKIMRTYGLTPDGVDAARHLRRDFDSEVNTLLLETGKKSLSETLLVESWGMRRDRCIDDDNLSPQAAREKAGAFDTVARHALNQFIEAFYIQYLSRTDNLHVDIKGVYRQHKKDKPEITSRRLNHLQQYEGKYTEPLLLRLYTEHLKDATSAHFEALGASKESAHYLTGHLIGRVLKMYKDLYPNNTSLYLVPNEKSTHHWQEIAKEIAIRVDPNTPLPIIPIESSGAPIIDGWMSNACTNGLDTGFIDLGYVKVALLGVLQGITELLPISSTAHMRVVPALLGWQDPGSAFSAAMQLAALLAVITYFRRDVLGLVTGSLRAVAARNWQSAQLRFSLGIVLATIPIGLGGIALSSLLNTCNSPLRSLSVIGASCLLMAVLLALAERLAAHQRITATARWMDFLIVGIAQVGALIPGISRSGSTLTAALFLGFTREEAAKFSFLIGLPAIALAGLKELAALSHAGLDAHGWSVLAVGLAVASISAFAAIWGLMRVLEKFSSWPFVFYRAALGIYLLAITLN